MKINPFCFLTKEGSIYYFADGIRDVTHGSQLCNVPGWLATHACLHGPLLRWESKTEGKWIPCRILSMGNIDAPNPSMGVDTKYILLLGLF